MTRGEDAPASPPDPAHFRTVLGHFATGVTVVTALDGGEPVGAACNSFTSVSLEPPLVLFCAAKESATWPRIRAAGRWTVNVLGEDGEELCRLFATSGADRFAAVVHTPGTTGAPVLATALAHLDCVTEAEHDAGDHVVVLGRVVGLGHAQQGRPLLYYRGGYGRFEP